MRTPLLALAASATLSLAGAAEPIPPNLLVILADDLGYGDVQALNPERGRIPTPHLDRLAAEGLRCTDAHGCAAVCTPTRYGLLTGRYAWRTRLQAGVLDGFEPPLIAPGRLTLPALLGQAGFRSACIGKWHLGFTPQGGAAADDGERSGKARRKGAAIGPGTLIPDGPLSRGFDAFYGFHHAREIETFFEGDHVAGRLEAVEVLPTLTARAVGFIEEQARSSRPFFLYLSLNSPHTPIVPAPAWKGRSKLGAYGDFVMQTDAAVGEVLAALERSGTAPRTLVVFSSDNGCSPHAGTVRLEKDGHFASAGFRGYKSDIWEGGHRVPFLARWPGVIAPGSSSPALVCLNDLMATMAEIVGRPLPAGAGEDSVSLLPLLQGKPGRRTELVHQSIDGRLAIRAGRWKLELCPGSGGWGSPKDAEAGPESPPGQLYDLEADPGERSNLWQTRPEERRRLHGLLAGIVARGRSTPGPDQANDAAVRLPEAR